MNTNLNANWLSNCFLNDTRRYVPLYPILPELNPWSFQPIRSFATEGQEYVLINEYSNIDGWAFPSPEIINWWLAHGEAIQMRISTGEYTELSKFSIMDSTGDYSFTVSIKEIFLKFYESAFSAMTFPIQKRDYTRFINDIVARLFEEYERTLHSNEED